MTPLFHPRRCCNATLRAALTTLLAALSLIGGLAGCAPSTRVSEALQNALAHAAPGDGIRVRDLTDFEWEALVVLGPYTTRETAEAALGFPWPGFERFDLASSDSFSVLVFMYKGSVVHAERHPRCKPDFAPGTLQRPLGRDVVVVIDGSGSCPLARAEG